METAHTYANLISDSLNVDSSQLEANLDNIITIFANYMTLIERSETEIESFEKHLSPSLEQKQADLEQLYNKLDNIETIVNCFKQSCDRLEQKIEVAERKFSLSKLNRLKSLIDSKISSKTEEESNLPAYLIECDKVFVKKTA